jgi:uncharacterized ParB-like nuclease family protein
MFIESTDTKSMPETLPAPAPTETRPPLRTRMAAYLGYSGTHGALAEVSAQPDPKGEDVFEVLEDIQTGEDTMTTLSPENPGMPRLLEAIRHTEPLSKPTFIAAESLKGSSVAVIKASPEKPVELPVRNFVFAAGMQDWNKGREAKESHKRIKDYARKNTEAPPIGMVVANVQPDGRTLYAAVQDGAHRLAAAHRRGDATIQVGGEILVKRLPENIIPVD